MCKRTLDLAAHGKQGFGWYEYGAVACLWCRNFFRQAHSRQSGGLDPTKYTCINKIETCDSFTQIYRCRKCKYNRCVKVGMQPSLVVAE